MAIFRKVHTSFWNDTKIEELESDYKYLYIYLLTNIHTNQVGCYEISLKQIAYDTDLDKSKLSNMITNLQYEYELIEYNENTKEIFIKNWHKYNWTKSPKVMACVLKERETIKNIEYRYSIDTLLNQYGYSMHTESQEEQEEEQEENNNKLDEKLDSPFLKDLPSKVTKRKLDAYMEEGETKTFIKYYNLKNDINLFKTNTNCIAISNALEDENIDLWKVVIEKSANKGHLIDGNFIKLSVEKMIENYSKILNDSYNLVENNICDVSSYVFKED